MYNFFASTLRALGDSQSPLYFLITSAVVNIVGDLFFVLYLHMGSEGCAISTVLSEALSCLLCIIYIQKKVPVLQLGRKWLVFDRAQLGKTIAYGWASAMQQATVQLGKLGIQAIVNSMGVSIAGGFCRGQPDRRFCLYAGAEYRPCHDGADGAEQRGREEGSSEGGISVRHPH